VIPPLLKDLLVPGSIPFFVIAVIAGTLLLYRRSDGGRAGRVWLTAVTLLYWILSTPATAATIVRLWTPDYPPVQSPAHAGGATAVVVLAAGMDVYHSRGGQFEASTRENALRILEGARVYRVLDHPFVVVSGGFSSAGQTEAARMAADLEAMGVPRDRIIQEGKSANTRDHARYIPPLLAERHVPQFVLVTSRQHIDRALRVFHKAGFDPVPSSPDLDLNHSGPLANFVPSSTALLASEELIYDKLGMVYYWLRGWI
jgi:uncharacterized SAM-binding protein YcdF (DUF218 family)